MVDYKRLLRQENLDEVKMSESEFLIIEELPKITGVFHRTTHQLLAEISTYNVSRLKLALHQSFFDFFDSVDEMKWFSEGLDNDIMDYAKRMSIKDVRYFPRLEYSPNKYNFDYTETLREYIFNFQNDDNQLLSLEQLENVLLFLDEIMSITKFATYYGADHANREMKFSKNDSQYTDREYKTLLARRTSIHERVYKCKENALIIEYCFYVLYIKPYIIQLKSRNHR